MSKGNRDRGGHRGQQMPKREEVSPGAVPVKPRAAVRPNWWRRMLRKVFPTSRAELVLLNDIPNLGENPPKPKSPSDTSESASVLELQERVEAIDRSLKELSKLSERVNTLYGIVDSLRKEVLGRKPAEDEDPNRLPKRNYDDLSASLADTSSTQRGGSQPNPVPNRFLASEPTIETLDHALCQALAAQTSAKVEIDALLADIRNQIGDVRIDVEYFGQRVTGQWQIAALLLPSTGQGLAIVSPGGLADSEVMSFFEVDLGRRIFSCIQPARVARAGNQLSVLRKGRVDNS